MDPKSSAKKIVLRAQAQGLGTVPSNFWQMSEAEQQLIANNLLYNLRHSDDPKSQQFARQNEIPDYSRASEIPEGKQWHHHPLATETRFSILVTTHLRDGCLKQLLESIDKYYPRVPVIVQETRGNLSWARNRLFESCETDYALLVEEDMQFVADTKIEPLCQILDEDPELIMAGGVILHNWDNWCHDFETSDGTLKVYPSRQPLRQTSQGIPYQPAQLLSNFGVLRVAAARECPWNEDLELQEHRAWFWSIRDKWKVAQTNECVIVHDSARTSREYDLRRNRAIPQFCKKAESTIGMPFGGCYENYLWGDERLPNIVILTPAHTNSTLLVKQLQCLGWHAGDIEPTYCEIQAINAINRNYLAGQEFDYAWADNVIQSLGQPWVIKDPRFCETMDRWRKVLFNYQPLLLYLRKDFEKMMATAKRGLYEADVLRRHHLAQEVYDKWVHRKFELDAEAIAKACSLFDRKRMEYAL